jgi:hypothetical protein
MPLRRCCLLCRKEGPTLEHRGQLERSQDADLGMASRQEAAIHVAGLEHFPSLEKTLTSSIINILDFRDA